MKPHHLVSIVSACLALSGCATEESSRGLSGAGHEQAGVSTSNQPADADGNKPPQVIRKVTPTYPYELKLMKITGTVIVRCVVDANGKARNIKVIKSPDTRFSKSAVAAISQWEFQPGMKQGEKASVEMEIPIEFGDQ